MPRAGVGVPIVDLDNVPLMRAHNRNSNATLILAHNNGSSANQNAVWYAPLHHRRAKRSGALRRRTDRPLGLATAVRAFRRHKVKADTPVRPGPNS